MIYNGLQRVCLVNKIATSRETELRFHSLKPFESFENKKTGKSNKKNPYQYVPVRILIIYLQHQIHIKQ